MNLKHLFLENDKDPSAVVSALSKMKWYINVHSSSEFNTRNKQTKHRINCTCGDCFNFGDSENLQLFINELKELGIIKIANLHMHTTANAEAEHGIEFNIFRQYWHPQTLRSKAIFHDEDDFGEDIEPYSYEFDINEEYKNEPMAYVFTEDNSEPVVLPTEAASWMKETHQKWINVINKELLNR